MRLTRGRRQSPPRSNRRKHESIAVEDTQARIAAIIASHPVVLFMKGTPARPQCGFSAATVAVMQRHDVSIHAVDVLADPAIRAGIKVYSDWPTIPQLYVNGEFVGGCDIVREMHETGELAELIAAGGRRGVA